MYEAVPVALRQRPQWGRWRIEKETKIPYRATEDRRASSSDPATWADYETALNSLTKRDAGLAWFFSDDDRLTGVDIDKCIVDGAISDAARAILDQLNSYSEISPSGTGVKVWVKGKLAASLKISNPEDGIVRIEIYSNRRFFAVTGRRLEEYPAEPQEAQEVLDMLARKYGKPEPAQQPQQAAPTMTGAQPDAIHEWVRAKVATACAMVATAAEGAKHDELLKAARLAGGLIPHISRMALESALEAAIRGRAIKDIRGALKTISDGLDMGEAQPLTPPYEPPALEWRNRVPYCTECSERVRKSKYHAGYYCANHTPAYNWKDLAAEEPRSEQRRTIEYVAGWQDSGTTLADLQHKEFPPEQWIVDQLLPPGLCLLAAKPKAKKSWLALHLGISVSIGTRFLNRYETLPGRVLYLDLEGTQRRIKKRTRAMLGAQAVKWPGNFHIYTDWPMGPDGLTQLEAWFSLYPDTRLVVIDVLASFRRPMDKAESFYQYDRDTVKPINDLLEHHDAAGVAVHHLNKAKAEDVFETISGSTGLVSVTNTQWALGRSPDDRATTIFSMQGRDLEVDEPLALGWDDYAHTHVVQGSAAEVTIGVERKAVREALGDDEPRTPKEIAEIVGKPVASIKMLLRKMLDEGLVDKVGYGKYAVVPLRQGYSGNSVYSDYSSYSVYSSEDKSKQSNRDEARVNGTVYSLEAHQDAANSPENTKSKQSNRDSIGDEKIAILGAILSRNTPQSEAHAARLCEQWGVELSSVRALALQTYRETEAEQ